MDHDELKIVPMT